jgi:hypothetical protein
MEGAMPKVDRWCSSMPRVEINWRARESRLRLEQLERLLVPRGVITVSWLKRVIYLFSFGWYEHTQARRTRGPLNNWRPSQPQFHQDWLEADGSFCRTLHHHLAHG